jgi:uncharacterized protein YndB with AHSA1/START domain
MPAVNASIEIGRPPDEVFAAVADPETRRRLLPDNFTGYRVISETRSGPGTRTAFRIVTGEGAYESEIELAEWDPPRALTERASGESPYTMRWSFVPAGDGTRVAVEMDYRVEGTFLHRLVERWFARRALERSVLVELLRLKQLLEG